MRKIFSLLIALFLVSTLNITTSDAQNFPQWHLPEGAIARLGKGPVNAVAYSPDGRYLAVGGGLGTWIYDADTGTEVSLLTEPPSNISSIAFSPDGNAIVSGGSITRVWDIATGTIITTINRGGVSRVAYSPDGNTIATVGDNSKIYLWDAATGLLKDTLSGHARTVRDVAFSPNGRILASAASGSGVNTVRLWDAATGTHIHKLEHPESVNSISFSPDSSVIASGVSGRGVYLWNVATGTFINKFGGISSPESSIVDKVVYSPDGRTIAAVYVRFGQVHLWDAATGTLKNTLEHKKYFGNKRYRYRVNSVSFTPDSNTLASGSLDGTVRLWNASTGALKNTITGHIHAVESVAFSPDGNTIAGGCGSRDWTVRLWDAATGTLRKTLIGHTARAGSVAFSPDGNTIASGSGDHSIRLWDAATGTFKNTLKGRDTISAPSIAYSPDGNTLAAAGRGLVNLWDTATDTLKGTLPDTGDVNDLAYSPDGTILASGGQDGTLRLWNAATGTLRNRLEYTDPGGVFSIAFSPDGTALASSFPPTSRTPLVHLWDVATGTLRYTFEHGSIATVIAYSPDGGTLATGDYGGVVRLWDAATGAFLQELTGHTDHVTDVVYNPDGTTLASGSSDGTVLLWRLTPASAPITFTPDSVADQTFTVGTVVNLTLPSATGGTAPYTYSLSPIPAGLQFDTTTQLLSGTPTTATPATSVTYTATDATGASVSLTFTITVTDAPATGITFVPNTIDDLTLTVNTPMDPLYLPLAEGGTSPYTYTLNPIPVGLSFDAATQLLSGTPTTVGTMPAVYIATDATGASAALNFIIAVIEDDPGDDALDVNGDGQVTVLDLAMVALFYGTQVPAGFSLAADVNTDGVVNLADLTVVAVAIDAAGGGANQLSLQEVELALLIAAEQAVELEAAAGAPGRAGTFGGTVVLSARLAAQNVSNVLAAARTDVRKPQKGFAVLEKFLALLTELTATPETTALLPNYPNPFNPETWIPYHLATDAEVKMTIYNVRADVVRALILGHQAAGVYESRGRAAYWDGKNQLGEKVASGVYFYTLTAGDFTATRKLLIAK